MKNFRNTLRARIEARKVEGEQGSLILDILIGMAIFALIAIIAVSAIGQYRARAYEQSASSDANALGLAVEAGITDGNVATLTQADGSADVAVGAETVTLSHKGDNVVTMGTAPTATNGYVFSLCVEHSETEWAVYNSAKGGQTAKGRDGGCASAAATAALSVTP